MCYLPGNAGRIDAVERLIFEQPQRFGSVDVFQVLALGPVTGWRRAVMGGVGVVTPFIGPGVRELVNAGLARNIRCNLSLVPLLPGSDWPRLVWASEQNIARAERNIRLSRHTAIREKCGQLIPQTGGKACPSEKDPASRS